MKFNYTKHKIRLDRGRMWYMIGVQTIVTAALVVIFTSTMAWYFKGISAIISIVIIYLLGWIDDKLKLLDKEQKGYAVRNEIMMQILERLETINTKLDEKSNK